MPGTPLSNPKPPAGPNAVGPTRPMTRAAASAPTALAGMSPKTPAKVPGLTTSVRTSGQLAQLPTPLKPVGMERLASVFDRLGGLLRNAERRFRMRKEAMFGIGKVGADAAPSAGSPGPRSPSAPISPPQAANTLPYDPNEW